MTQFVDSYFFSKYTLFIVVGLSRQLVPAFWECRSFCMVRCTPPHKAAVVCMLQQSACCSGLHAAAVCMLQQSAFCGREVDMLRRSACCGSLHAAAVCMLRQSACCGREADAKRESKKTRTWRLPNNG